jgi:hypothetical protein
MHDLLSSFKPLDPGRVNTMDPVELQYWCELLQCSQAQLERAIDEVGDHVAEVRQALAAGSSA